MVSTRNRLGFGMLLLFIGCKAECTTVSSDDGGEGGAGGSATNGVTNGSGATGGGGSSSGAGGAGGSATNGAGGAGGGAACVGHDGTGVSVDACASLAGGLAQCPSTGNPPPALPLCERSFELFSPGARENLIACLDALGLGFEAVCDEPAASDNAGACIGEMYAESCENPDSDALCESFGDQCAMSGDATFPVDACSSDLRVFGDEGRTAYVECANAAPGDVTCGGIHTYCFEQLFVY